MSKANLVFLLILSLSQSLTAGPKDVSDSRLIHKGGYCALTILILGGLATYLAVPGMRTPVSPMQPPPQNRQVGSLTEIQPKVAKPSEVLTSLPNLQKPIDVQALKPLSAKLEEIAFVPSERKENFEKLGTLLLEVDRRISEYQKLSNVQLIIRLGEIRDEIKYLESKAIRENDLQYYSSGAILKFEALARRELAARWLSFYAELVGSAKLKFSQLSADDSDTFERLLEDFERGRDLKDEIDFGYLLNFWLIQEARTGTTFSVELLMSNRMRQSQSGSIEFSFLSSPLVELRLDGENSYKVVRVRR